MHFFLKKTCKNRFFFVSLHKISNDMKKLFILSLALIALMACTNTENPLLTEQNTPYGVPAFDKVKTEHYMPAFEKAIAENKAEIDAIVANTEAPTFENTIAALDRTGALLDRVVGVFFNILDADGNDEMNAIAERLHLCSPNYPTASFSTTPSSNA